MEIVKEPKIDWLDKKWILLVLSLLLVVASVASINYQGGLDLGIDFTGGTLVHVKFRQQPQLDQIRRSLGEAGLRPEQVTRFDEPSKNQVQIRMARIESEETEDLSEQSDQVVAVLRQSFDAGEGAAGALDLNNVSRSRLATRLQELDPEKLRASRSVTEFTLHYEEMAERLVDHRTQQGGILQDFETLAGLNLPTPVAEAFRKYAVLGSFSVISVDSVGPKVGRELRKRARDAVIFSLLGMLIYIAYRFKPIYGLAAIVALFHDVFITVGAFSIANKEISLTVIAALLTLVGYSINDTIVVFDRVRENLRLMRRVDMKTILNRSINQTLNRTIMTSGMTFLAVLSLLVLGGEALNGFSFALVIGIIVGTYSSIAIASPIVLWWQDYSDRKKKKA